MIISEQKPFEEILGYLDGENAVFVLGCSGCAESSGSGGPAQVAEMKARLESAGKTVTGTRNIDFLCEKALVKSGLRGNVAEVMQADSVLVLTCGIGVQAVAEALTKPVYPGCDTINLGGKRGEWEGSERCAECGQCYLFYTGGICPITACTKSLVSGACGGANHGMCEVSPDKPCGWERIYERLKEKGQLERLALMVDVPDYRKRMLRPEMLHTQRFALEEYDTEVKVE
jgi:hypothetical protein